MRKFIFFAAALLVLVGCNKNEQKNRENAPAEMVTITGGIDFSSSQAGARKIVAKPGWEEVTDGNQVEFMWEEGDEIAVVDELFTECHKFTVSKISEDGATAEFTGEPLSSGMEKYFVCYPYEFGVAHLGDDYAIDEWFKHQQYTGKFNPVCEVQGSNNSFAFNCFFSVLDLSLIGEVALGKIELYVASSAGSYETECSDAISMGEDGLQLTNEPKHVTFSVFPNPNEGLMLKFYDANDQLLMEKAVSEKDLIAPNQILSFPVLEVTAVAPVEWTKDLELGKETATAIVIETGKDVSGYSEDATHKPLNDDNTLWEYLDGTMLRIQTPANKINSSLEGMFSEYEAVQTITGLQHIHATTAEKMFAYCQSLTSIDFTGFNTEDITDMNYMFHNCESLVDLDLSNFNTANVTNMSNMFATCTGFTNLNLSNFNTANVTTMSGMFSGMCNLRGLTLSGDFKVAGVKYGMFSGCGNAQDGCTVYNVGDTQIQNDLKTDTGWDENKMHFM